MIFVFLSLLKLHCFVCFMKASVWHSEFLLLGRSESFICASCFVCISWKPLPVFFWISPIRTPLLCASQCIVCISWSLPCVLSNSSYLRTVHFVFQSVSFVVHEPFRVLFRIPLQSAPCVFHEAFRVFSRIPLIYTQSVFVLQSASCVFHEPYHVLFRIPRVSRFASWTLPCVPRSASRPFSFTFLLLTFWFALTAPNAHSRRSALYLWLLDLGPEMRFFMFVRESSLYT